MKKQLNRFAVDLLRRLGYTIIPNWRVETFPSTAYLQKLFSLLNVDCVIDVGANSGQYRNLLREHLGFQGRIISFEPVPPLATELKHLAADDEKWTVHGCALGAAAGRLEFNVMNDTQFSSFLSPDHSVIDRFRLSNDVKERISVEVRTLDDVIPELRQAFGIANIYLKLDTQGYDLEVLKGASTVLPSVLALQTEASVRPIYGGMPHYTEVVRFLEAHEFQMSGIFPNNSGHFPLLIEFDCHMINGAFLSRRSAI